MEQNYPARREIPPGKVMLADLAIAEHRADVQANRQHVHLIAEAPMIERLRRQTYDGKVLLIWSSPGFEISGSMMRWTNGFWGVRWWDRSYAIQGRRYSPDDEGEGKARDHFKRLTEEPMP